MENYLETTLKIPIDKNYINTQAITQNNDKDQILRMVVGVVTFSAREP
jgi:hypothetical protein